MPDDRFIHRRAGRSQKVNILTDLEYRVWTQYILSADDFGVMRGTHHQLQADNDHLANRPARVIQRCLDALVKSGLIRRFEHQGKPHVYQHDWQTWQKVSYPRTTNQPAPPHDALKDCDENTQRLFQLHPGGAGRTRKELSENIPETFPKDSPLMRAGQPAKRLTANGLGERLPANGSGVQFDVWFRELQALYPPQGVSGGALTEDAFCQAILRDPRPARVVFDEMLANLENQKRGHQWLVKRMIPRLNNWLRDDAWKQQHDEHPPSTLVNDKTVRALTSGAAFVAGGSNGPR